MHTDPELLSLLALGEFVGTEDERAHAQTCPDCAGELSTLHRVVTVGRSVGAKTGLAIPRHDVWTRIRAELALAPTVEPPAHPPDLLTSDTPRPAAVTRPLNVPSPGSVRERVRRSLPSISKASITGPPHGDTELAAHAQLTPVDPSWSHASGVAELATDEHGRRMLQVALHADLPTAGLRQAWLVHRNNPELRQTLGILDGPHGLWTVEHSIDLEEYAILDISQQSTGQTEHSGQSIVRGEFTLVG